MLRARVSSTIVPVSVVVPTIGRVEQLPGASARSPAASPAPTRSLVADQSGDPAVADLVARFADAGVKLVRCDGRGPAVGRNTGLRTNEVVAMTDDDCAVAPDWVGTAWRLMQEDPDRIVTGRVLAVGDPDSVHVDERADDAQGLHRSRPPHRSLLREHGRRTGACAGARGLRRTVRP